MAAPPNEFFIVLSGFGFFFCAIPFWWHLQSWNVGTCLFMFWVGLGCLNAMINAIIWNHNVLNTAPVWCDISTRFMVGVNVGLPAAILVIMLRLWKIASLRSAQITQAERRRGIIIDLTLGLGLPILQMGLQVIVQSNRFNIFEDVGCFWNVHPSWPAWVLVYPWSLLLSVASWGFGGAAYYHLRNRAVQFAEFASSNARAHRARYLRLLLMTALVLTFSFADAVQVVLQDARGPLFPWISWADTHFDFGFVGQKLRKDMPAEAVIAVELQRWMLVLSAFVFFAFFGFADEARTHYRKVYAIAHTAAFSAASSSPGNSSFGNLRTPRLAVTVSKESLRFPPTPTSASVARKRETMDSFIDTLTLASSDGARPDSPTLPHPPGLAHTPQLSSIGLSSESHYPPTPRSPAHHRSFLDAATPTAEDGESFLKVHTPTPLSSPPVPVTPAPHSPTPPTPPPPVLRAAPAGRHAPPRNSPSPELDTDKPLPPPPVFLAIDPRASPRHRVDAPRSAKAASLWSLDPTLTRSDTDSYF